MIIIKYISKYIFYNITGIRMANKDTLYLYTIIYWKICLYFYIERIIYYVYFYCWVDEYNRIYMILMLKVDCIGRC